MKLKNYEIRKFTYVGFGQPTFLIDVVGAGLPLKETLMVQVEEVSRITYLVWQFKFWDGRLRDLPWEDIKPMFDGAVFEVRRNQRTIDDLTAEEIVGYAQQLHQQCEEKKAEEARIREVVLKMKEQGEI